MLSNYFFVELNIITALHFTDGESIEIQGKNLFMMMVYFMGQLG